MILCLFLSNSFQFFKHWKELLYNWFDGLLKFITSHIASLNLVKGKLIDKTTIHKSHNITLGRRGTNKELALNVFDGDDFLGIVNKHLDDLSLTVVNVT